MSLRISAFVVALLLVGCGDQEIKFTPDSSAQAQLAKLPGAIRIGINDGGEEKRVEMRSGVIKPVSERIGAVKEASSYAGGATMLPDRPDVEYKGPYAFSPGMKYIVASVMPRKSEALVPSSFSVVDFSDKKVMATVKGDANETIRAVAWSPDGEAIAILKGIEYPSSFSIKGWIAGMSGHPMRSDTYFLETYDRKGRRQMRAKLAERVPQSVVEIAWVN
jgi:hypothetical protein